MKLIALASLCLALVSGCVTTGSETPQKCCQKAGTAKCCAKTGQKANCQTCSQ